MADFPVPVNIPGMAAVRPEDGEQEGDLIELPEFDDLHGGY